MSFRHTLEILHKQAEEIEQVTVKFTNEEELRKIDIDLLLAKLRNIYDLALDLETSVSAPAPKAEVSREKNEPQVSEDIPFEIESEQTTEEPQEEIKEEPKRETIAKKPVEEPKKPEPKPQDESAFLSDKFRSKERILNEEIMGKSTAGDITKQYTTSPISSITSALGLNEKFELINELFDGNKQSFDKTIEVLNMASSFVEAYNYLESTFGWDMDDPHVQRLLELIRRKLIVRRNES